jgi:hypothetical protein
MGEFRTDNHTTHRSPKVEYTRERTAHALFAATTRRDKRKLRVVPKEVQWRNGRRDPTFAENAEQSLLAVTEAGKKLATPRLRVATGIRRNGFAGRGRPGY